LVEEIRVRGVWTSESCISHKICREFFYLFIYHFVNSYSHATSYTPCAKAKATYKPFDVDKAHAKARAEVV